MQQEKTKREYYRSNPFYRLQMVSLANIAFYGFVKGNDKRKDITLMAKEFVEVIGIEDLDVEGLVSGYYRTAAVFIELSH